MSAYFYNQPKKERETTIDYDEIHSIFEKIDQDIGRSITHTENKNYRVAAFQINEETMAALNELKETLEKSSKYTEIISS